MADINKLSDASALLQLQAARSAQNVSHPGSVMSPENRSAEALEKASQQFEALLLNIMIKEMRATVPESDLFPRSMADEIFTGMLDEQYADTMARNGGIGLSEMVVDQLKNSESDSRVIDKKTAGTVKLK
ncbi:hypothetical protein DESC_300044 [Desulfosarcina cetonica]|uniref:rod-binding protein n=1 Tax=Desulfosarcina cetonica TaxID=90730 RepID=UPI0006D007DE|nr:rod-binding protein [Desulfosarcina cetonica]VTR65248.1 hypothetical protein DESC_300044 [Desulfosarcina cetonica]